MRYKVRGGLRVEQIDGDVLVLDGDGGAVHRLTGDAAAAILLAAAHVEAAQLDPSQATAMAELEAADLVEAGGWSRRKMLAMSATGTAVGITYLALPTAAYAQSGPPSNTPTQPVIDSVATGSTTASIAYTPPTNDGGSAITGYQVSLDGGTTWSATQLITNPLPVTGLTAGTSYQFDIRAVNGNGVGAPSNVVAATTDGSVTFDATGVFTAPAGVTSVALSAWGGGGGGAAGNTGGNGTPGGRGGGGGGFSSHASVAVTPGQDYTVTVGAGGASGVAGGTSTFQAISAGGGGAGTGPSAGGAGGTSSGGTINTPGGPGGNGTGAGPNGPGGGGGAAGNPAGAGANGTTASGSNVGSGGTGANGAGSGGTGASAGNAAANAGSGNGATTPGGGGGGGGRAAAGGSGAPGRVVISWT